MNNKSFTKKVEPTGEVCIKFTEEEMELLEIKEGDKFSIEECKDGGLLLKKYQKLELDLSEFSREHLEHLVKQSCDNDVSVNEIFEDSIKTFLKLDTP